MKKVYRVKLNWHGEEHEFFTVAHMKTSAMFFAAERLAGRLQMATYAVWSYFVGSRDNYKIEEVAKVGQKEEGKLPVAEQGKKCTCKECGCGKKGRKEAKDDIRASV